MSLAELARSVAPPTLAGDRQLPVLGVLAPLFTGGGLRRGSVVTVDGSTSLALALAVGPTAVGSWCAVVGYPALGIVAAAELGLDLGRLALVPRPAAKRGPGDWAWVVAALVDGFDVVLAWPPSKAPVRAVDARRLAARTRERGAVLIVVKPPKSGVGTREGTERGWPDAADLGLRVIRSEWHGLGAGHGHLRARRIEVVAAGRGAAARPRQASMWLPGTNFGVEPIAPSGADTKDEPKMSAVG